MFLFFRRPNWFNTFSGFTSIVLWLYLIELVQLIIQRKIETLSAYNKIQYTCDKFKKNYSFNKTINMPLKA